MFILPQESHALLLALTPVFTEPTFRRACVLLGAALLCRGRHTIAQLLRTVGVLAPGHKTSYQRVLSQAQWSGLHLACALCRFVVAKFLPQGILTVVIDDTVESHPGRNVFGKARHRDPVRSSRSYVAWRYGHKWIVVAVLVRFPFATRAWALPVLVDLYRSEQDNHARGQRHRTPAQRACRLVRVLLRWFPDRQFRVVVDAGYGSHETARFVTRYGQRLSLVSKLPLDANLFEPPPPYRGKGRPRVKGKALPKPCAVVAKAKWRRLTVSWYGGGQRRVQVVSGQGHWYRSGAGLVALRWVYVHDCTGTHRDEYFYSTDLTLTPAELITCYTSRWNIETTFQEMRAHLGLETTRGWCRQTILRAAPCLFGLYTVTALLFDALPPAKRDQGAILWPGKTTTTFSDALTAVRLWLWSDWVFAQADEGPAVQKLPPKIQDFLLSVLASAA
jgi:hypothetical protein